MRTWRGFAKLVGIVVGFMVIAHNPVIGSPGKDLGEVSKVLGAEHVSVVKSSPNTQRSSFPDFDVLDFLVKENALNDCAHYSVLVRSDNCAADRILGRQAEVVAVAEGNRKNVRLDLVNYVMGRGKAGVDKNWAGFKSQVLFTLLIGGSTYDDANISAHLFPPELSLHLHQLTHMNHVLVHGVGNAFHRTCCPGRFFHMCIGRTGSFDCHFPTFLGVADSTPSFTPKQAGKPPEARRSEEQQTSEPGYPPVWSRIPVALALGLGSNGVLAWGLLIWDGGRRLIGGVCCLAAMLMFIGGAVLMVLLGVPATWSWWL